MMEEMHHTSLILGLNMQTCWATSLCATKELIRMSWYEWHCCCAHGTLSWCQSKQLAIVTPSDTTPRHDEQTVTAYLHLPRWFNMSLNLYNLIKWATSFSQHLKPRRLFWIKAAGIWAPKSCGGGLQLSCSVVATADTFCRLVCKRIWDGAMGGC